MEEQHNRRSILGYFRNSLEELRKVTWPTKSQALNMTILVIVISLLVAGFIAAVDYILTFGYDQLLELGTSGSGSEISAPVDINTDSGLRSVIELPTD